MILSDWGIVDRGLKCAHGFLPHLVEMSAQTGNAFRIQPVKAAGSGLRIGHQARVFQYAQVLGDRWTADGQEPGQLIHGDGSAGQLLEDGHACRVCQGVQAGL